MSIFLALKFLHILVAGVWMGAGLLAPRDVCTSLEDPAQHAAMIGRLRATAALMNRAALFTLVTGFALIHERGGLAAAPTRIVLGLLLTLLACGAGRFLIRPVLADLRGVIGQPLPEGAAQALSRRFTRAVRMEDLIRALVLAVMVFPVP